MAASKSYFANRANYRFFSNEPAASAAAAAAAHDTGAFEFDESDVIYSSPPEVCRPAWGSSDSSSRASAKKSSASSAAARRADGGDRRGSTPSSLPVNIPDWSKILRGEYRENRRRDSLGDTCYSDDDEDACGGGEDGGRVPPHEFLARQMARTRIASSVHEGVGRTLKGRDLSRVRNAIWEKTGFED